MASKPAKKKRIARLDPCDRLLRAAARYVAWRGGQAIIGGPVGITTIPNSGKILPEFYLMVKIMGKLPTKSELKAGK